MIVKACRVPFGVVNHTFFLQLWMPLGWVGVLTVFQSNGWAVSWCPGPGFLGKPSPAGFLGPPQLVPRPKSPNPPKYVGVVSCPTNALAFLIVKQIALVLSWQTHVFWMSNICSEMSCKAQQCKAVQSKAKQCKAKQSNAVQSNEKQSKAKQSNATQCTAKQSNAKQCKTKQSKAM